MAAPRKIETSKRAREMDAVVAQITRVNARVERVIADLSKDHVDDKTEAKAILAKAKGLQKTLGKLLS